MDNEIISFFHLYGYWIIFFGVMLENAGLPIPGDIFIFMAGALAGMGKLDFMAVSFTAIAGAVIGDSISYYVGRRGGKRLIDLYCAYTICTSRCGEKVELFYAKFGAITIPVARFIPGVRALSAPAAGAARISYIKFLTLDIIGATAWAITFLLAGFLFRNGIFDLIHLFEKIRYGFVVLVLFVIAVFISFKLSRRRLLGRPDLRGLFQRLRAMRKHAPGRRLK